jgi:YggT family protein
MMQTLGEILYAVLNVARWVLIIHIAMGWLINFQVLNMQQPMVRQIYYSLSNLLEPIYRPIRNILPSAGGMDFSPIVVFLGIYALQRIVVNNLIYGSF